MNAPLFLGRQPILDVDYHLIAFELLFHPIEGNVATGGDRTADEAVFGRNFSAIGLENVLGDYRGFINIDEELLSGIQPQSLPGSRIVLQIPPTLALSPAAIERCRFLANSGYTLALADVSDYDSNIDALLEFVSIVKIDLKKVKRENLPAIIAQFRRWKVLLLAEKVETPEVFRQCRELGFDLFQGYYFARAHIVKGKKLSHSRAALMKLLEMVINDADIGEIEEALKENPFLSINLLKLTNSVAFGSLQEITSLKAAITFIGRKQLKRWIQLLLYTGQSGEPYSNPLLQLAAARGKTMELLADKKELEGFGEAAFMTGIMSLMEALFSIPLSEIIAPMKVPTEIKLALIDRMGKLGSLLLLTESLEKDKGVEKALSATPYLTLADVDEAHCRALAWANSVCRS